MSDKEELLDPSFKDGSENNNGFRNGTLPNATATLVLGIISIVGCLFYGVPGLICGIIALVLYKKDNQLYESDKAYYEASHKNSKAGYVCAIIGTSLSAIYFVVALLILVFALSAGLAR